MSLEVTNPAQTTYNFYVSIKKFILKNIKIYKKIAR